MQACHTEQSEKSLQSRQFYLDSQISDDLKQQYIESYQNLKPHITRNLKVIFQRQHTDMIAPIGNVIKTVVDHSFFQDKEQDSFNHKLLEKAKQAEIPPLHHSPIKQQTAILRDLLKPQHSLQFIKNQMQNEQVNKIEDSKFVQLTEENEEEIEQNQKRFQRSKSESKGKRSISLKHITGYKTIRLTTQDIEQKKYTNQNFLKKTVNSGIKLNKLENRQVQQQGLGTSIAVQQQLDPTKNQELNNNSIIGQRILTQGQNQTSCDIKVSDIISNKILPVNRSLAGSNRKEKCNTENNPQLMDEQDQHEYFLPLEFYNMDDEDQFPKILMQKYRDSITGRLFGYSKFFLNQGGCEGGILNQQMNFEWRKCEILEYKEEEERYEIIWPNGQKKLVSRVNLRFEHESKETFNKKLNAAEYYRQVSELYHKYNYMIDAMEAEGLNSTPPTQFFVNILMMSAGRSYFDEQQVIISRNPEVFNKMQPEQKFNFSQQIQPQLDEKEISQKMQQAQTYLVQKQFPLSRVSSLLQEVKQAFLRTNKQIKFNSMLPYSIEKQLIFKRILPPKYFEIIVNQCTQTTDKQGCIDAGQSKDYKYEDFLIKYREIQNNLFQANKQFTSLLAHASENINGLQQAEFFIRNWNKKSVDINEYTKLQSKYVRSQLENLIFKFYDINILLQKIVEEDKENLTNKVNELKKQIILEELRAKLLNYEFSKEYVATIEKLQRLLNYQFELTMRQAFDNSIFLYMDYFSGVLEKFQQIQIHQEKQFKEGGQPSIGNPVIKKKLSKKQSTDKSEEEEHYNQEQDNNFKCVLQFMQENRFLFYQYVPLEQSKFRFQGWQLRYKQMEDIYKGRKQKILPQRLEQTTMAELQQYNKSIRGQKQEETQPQFSSTTVQRDEMLLCKVQVELADCEIHLSPSPDEWQLALTKIIEQLFSQIQQTVCFKTKYIGSARLNEQLHIFEGGSRDPVLESARREVQQSVTRCVEILRIFERQLRIDFAEIFKNTTELLKKKMQKRNSFKEFEQKINQRSVAKELLAAHLFADTLRVGIFEVNVERFRMALIEKLEKDTKVIYEVLIEKISHDNITMEKDINEIIDQLNQIPDNLEQLQQLRNFCNDQLPHQTMEIKKRIDTNINKMNLLEIMYYKISYEDFFKTWSIYGMPLLLNEKNAKCLKQLQNYERKFAEDLRKQQFDLSVELKTIKSEVETLLDEYEIQTRLDEISFRYSEMNDRIESAIKETQLVNRREKILKWEQTDAQPIQKIAALFLPYRRTWQLAKDYSFKIPNIMQSPLNSLDRDSITNDILSCWQELLGYEKGVFKTVPHMKIVVVHARKQYESFKPQLPLINYLRNPAMEIRHWNNLNKLIKIHNSKCDKKKDMIGAEFDEDLLVTLDTLLKNNISVLLEDIRNVSEISSKEKNFEKIINKMKANWKPIKLNLVPHKATGSIVLSGLETIFEKLDEDIMKTQTISSSPYIKFFEAEVVSWRNTLLRIQENLELWIKVQKQWLHLYPVFQSDDINADLPKESSRFRVIDKMWNGLMETTIGQPNVLDACTQSKQKELFQQTLDQVDMIIRSLQSFLNKKRQAFPRFYFLSNDELLSILSQGHDPSAVQRHLPKCFEGIAFLTFSTVPREMIVDQLNQRKLQYKKAKLEQLNGKTDLSNKQEIKPQNKKEEAEDDQQEIVCTIITEIVSSSGETIALASPIFPFHDEESEYDDQVNTKTISINKNSKKKQAGDEEESDSAGEQQKAKQVKEEGGPAPRYVEIWLSELDQEMKQTLLHTLIKVLQEYEPSENPENWLFSWPAQLVIIAFQIIWTQQVTEALLLLQEQSSKPQRAQSPSQLQKMKSSNRWTEPQDPLTSYCSHLNEILIKIVRVVRRQTVSVRQRQTLSNFITILVHLKDIVEELVKLRVSRVGDFEWQQQMRYYILNKTSKQAEPSRLEVRMVSAVRPYGFEYLGSHTRLVVTPLTERCCRTLMTALQHNLGGAPEGPAGTGKTETTKDLAKALAKHCLVFNCSDALDPAAMGKFFKGICACGSWACFDEFNRIELEVLSVIAQQILTIQSAIFRHSQMKNPPPGFAFEGDAAVPLDPSCAIFVTMNPGYKGRADLPDNLKVLFRPVAMMIPNYTHITEISLYSFGYVHARKLAVKVIAALRLSSEQLSSQGHYDFGMRAVKTIILAAKQLKVSSLSQKKQRAFSNCIPGSEEQGEQVQDEEFSEIDEEVEKETQGKALDYLQKKERQKQLEEAKEHILIMRAISECNLPKFSEQDVPLFNAIISDLFPNMTGQQASPDQQEIQQLAELVLSERQFSLTEHVSSKVCQLYQTVKVRHGIMLVGATNSGKSTVMNTLASSLELRSKLRSFQQQYMQQLAEQTNSSVGETAVAIERMQIRKPSTPTPDQNVALQPLSQEKKLQGSILNLKSSQDFATSQQIIQHVDSQPLSIARQKSQNLLQPPQIQYSQAEVPQLHQQQQAQASLNLQLNLQHSSSQVEMLHQLHSEIAQANFSKLYNMYKLYQDKKKKLAKTDSATDTAGNTQQNWRTYSKPSEILPNHQVILTGDLKNQLASSNGFNQTNVQGNSNLHSISNNAAASQNVCTNINPHLAHSMNSTQVMMMQQNSFDSQSFQKVSISGLNPKSISTKMLFGYVDDASGEWCDGVIAKIFRDCSQTQQDESHQLLATVTSSNGFKESNQQGQIDNRQQIPAHQEENSLNLQKQQSSTGQFPQQRLSPAASNLKQPSQIDQLPQQQHLSPALAGQLSQQQPQQENERPLHWILFDGPVDALWIENLNTVLDDNKKLCLMNSETIKLTDQMSVFFEVEDLQDASPATVSRCGMVYMEASSLQEELSWDMLMLPWFTGSGLVNSAAHRGAYQCLVKHFLPEVFAFILGTSSTGNNSIQGSRTQSNSSRKTVVPVSRLVLMRSFLNVLESLLMRKKTRKQLAQEAEINHEKEVAKLQAARLEGKEQQTSGVGINALKKTSQVLATAQSILPGKQQQQQSKNPMLILSNSQSDVQLGLNTGNEQQSTLQQMQVLSEKEISLIFGFFVMSLIWGVGVLLTEEVGRKNFSILIEQLVQASLQQFAQSKQASSSSQQQVEQGLKQQDDQRYRDSSLLQMFFKKVIRESFPPGCAPPPSSEGEQQPQHQPSKQPDSQKSILFDLFFDPDKLQWCQWQSNSFTSLPVNLQFHELFVPTTSTVRYTSLLHSLILQEKAVLLIGRTGTGKTVMTKRFLFHDLSSPSTTTQAPSQPAQMTQQMATQTAMQTGNNGAVQLQQTTPASQLTPQSFVVTATAFSTTTSAQQVQDVFESRLEKQKRRKGVYGPLLGTINIVFVDDFNMPQREHFGARPPHELVRQWFVQGGWYERRQLEFNRITDFQFVAAMTESSTNASTTSIQTVRNTSNSSALPSSRLLRHFNVLYMAEDPSNQCQIIRCITQWGFADYIDRVQQVAQGLIVPLVQALHEAVIKTFRPLPLKSHYIFNLRDLMQALQGLLQVPEHKYSALDDVRFKLLRLWVHESRRVYYDRLVDEADRQLFDQILVSSALQPLQLEFQAQQQREQKNKTGKNKTQFSDDFTPFSLQQLESSDRQLGVQGSVTSHGLLYGNFLQEDPVYQEFVNHQELLECVQQYLNKYNNSKNFQKEEEIHKENIHKESDNILKGSESKSRAASNVFGSVASKSRNVKVSEVTTSSNNVKEKEKDSDMPKINIILFEQAISMICKICRIISFPFGSALLIGHQGFGSRSLSRLATFIQGYRLYTLDKMLQSQQQQTTSSSSGVTAVPPHKEFLMEMLHNIALRDTRAVLLATDDQLQQHNLMHQSSLLEDVACLLNIGEIPNLFPPDEKETLIQDMKEETDRLRLALNPIQVWEFIINRCKVNLHMILCLSPDGDGLRTRTRNFPALISCTQPIWIQPWFKESLQEVARISLAKVKFPNEGEDLIISSAQANPPKSLQIADYLDSKLQQSQQLKQQNQSGLIPPSIVVVDVGSVPQKPQQQMELLQTGLPQMGPQQQNLGPRQLVVPQITSAQFSPQANNSIIQKQGEVINTSFQLQNSEQEALSGVLADIHSSACTLADRYSHNSESRPHVYVAPSCFLKLLRNFQRFYEIQLKNLKRQRDSYTLGVQKLDECEKMVDAMKQELALLQPSLAAKTQEIEEIMAMAELDNAEAEKQRAVVQQDELETSKQAAEASKIKELCREKLSVAEPQLKEAINLLKTLKVTDFIEMKSLKNPPQLIRLTMDAVCILLGQKGKKDSEGKSGASVDYWDDTRNLLNNPSSFIRKLEKYDCDNISEAVIGRMKAFLERNTQFTPAVVAKASQAAEGLCKWARSVYDYHFVYKSIMPLRQNLEEANKLLEAATAELLRKRQLLQEAEEKCLGVRKRVDQISTEKQNLVDQIQECQTRFDRALELTSKLVGEKQRWGARSIALNSEIRCLLGDILLSAGVLTYLGAFPGDWREQIIMEQWIPRVQQAGIQCSDKDFSVLNCIGSPLEMQDWLFLGLPNDTASKETALIMKYVEDCPLLIDPQFQAIKFIKKLETAVKETNLMVAKPGRDFRQKLEKCMAMGITLLLQNCGEAMDPIVPELLDIRKTLFQARLDSIVSDIDGPLNQFDKEGFSKAVDNRSLPIQDNKKNISTTKPPHVASSHSPHSKSDIVELYGVSMILDRGFRLYLATNLACPHFAAELQMRVTMLNFTITPEALKDQMLSILAREEDPKLEDDKNSLLHENAQGKKRMEQVETSILALLSSAADVAHMLDTDDLIVQLNASRQTAIDIEARFAETRTTTELITRMRLGFESVATFASALFFVLLRLAKLDHMYQFSFEFFARVFRKAIRLAEKPSAVNPGNTQQQQTATISGKRQVQAIRAANIIESLKKNIYQEMSRSLFVKHKLLFLFLLTLTDLQVKGLIEPEELAFLLSGGDRQQEENNNNCDLQQQIDSQSNISVVRLSSAYVNPDKKLFSQTQWSEIALLNQLKNFDSLSLKIALNIQPWRAYIEGLTTTGIAESHMPEPFNTLGSFSKLLFIKSARPELFINKLMQFIETELGPYFKGELLLPLKQSIDESSATAPMLFILSPGDDPADELKKVAQDLGKYLTLVSLGKGQGNYAAEQIRMALESGQWVFLQNCHLAASWLSTLEEIATSDIAQRLALSNNISNNVKASSDFRLFLSSLSTPQFPITLLQECVKVTKDPPKGIRNNLNIVLSDLQNASAATLTSLLGGGSGGGSSGGGGQGGGGGQYLHHNLSKIDKTFLQTCQKSLPLWRRLLFSLSFFHAVVRERRTFSSIGWNIHYDFNESDFKISSQQIRSLLLINEEERVDQLKKKIDNLSGKQAEENEQEEYSEEDELNRNDNEGNLEIQQKSNYFDGKIQFKAVNYLIGECFYGGRVTDDWDRRLLSTMVSSFFNPDAISNEDKDCVNSAKQRSSMLLTIPSDEILRDLEQATSFINSMPEYNDPTLFGLNHNAAISQAHLQLKSIVDWLILTEANKSSFTVRPGISQTCLNNNSNIIKDTEKKANNLSLKSSEPPTQAIQQSIIMGLSNSGENRGNFSAPEKGVQLPSTAAALAEGILQQLPNDFDVATVRSKFQVSYLESLNVVLLQEVQRYNTLLGVIRSPLEELLLAEQGLSLMTPELDSLAESLLLNRIPALWMNKSYPSLKPLSSYIRDLQARIKMFNLWIASGSPPAVFWVSGFYFTQGFFTSVKQNYARKNKVPIDQVDFSFSVLDNQLNDVQQSNVSLPETGCYTTGLYLEGAAWNFQQHMMDEAVLGLIYCVMPIIWFIPIDQKQQQLRPLQLKEELQTQDDKLIDNDSSQILFSQNLASSTFEYQCPMYKTTDRKGVLSTTGHSTNYILSVALPASRNSDHWVKRGAALITQLNE